MSLDRIRDILLPPPVVPPPVVAPPPPVENLVLERPYCVVGPGEFRVTGPRALFVGGFHSFGDANLGVTRQLDALRRGWGPDSVHDIIHCTSAAFNLDNLRPHVAWTSIIHIAAHHDANGLSVYSDTECAYSCGLSDDMLAGRIQNYLEETRTKVEFVFLAACNSVELGRKLLDAGVGCVLSYNGDLSINVSDMVTFFYESLRLCDGDVAVALSRVKGAFSESRSPNFDPSSWLLMSKERPIYPPPDPDRKPVPNFVPVFGRKILFLGGFPHEGSSFDEMQLTECPAVLTPGKWLLSPVARRVQRGRIADMLDQQQPNILHIAAHHVPEKGILVGDDVNASTSAWLSDALLEHIVKGHVEHNPGLELIFLSAGESRELAERLSRVGVPLVILHNGRPTARTALEVAREFYRALDRFEKLGRVNVAAARKTAFLFGSLSEDDLPLLLRERAPENAEVAIRETGVRLDARAVRFAPPIDSGGYGITWAGEHLLVPTGDVGGRRGVAVVTPGGAVARYFGTGDLNQCFGVSAVGDLAYACDLQGQRVVVYRISDGEKVSEFAVGMQPFDVEATKDAIFVSCRDSHCLRVFKPDGTRIGNESIRLPRGLAVDAGILYIALGTGPVAALDMNGPRWILTPPIGAKCSMRISADVCVARKVMFVADLMQHRVAVFSLDGVFLGNLGIGEITHPSGLSMRDGNLYVVCEEGIVSFHVFAEAE